MFKAIGTFIHKTPWWALILLGFSTLAFLVVFTTPFQLLRLSESGSNPEERRQIKKEIESAWVDSGLGVAEGVVAGFRERATDPARKAELDKAMDEISRARQEILNAEKDGSKAAKQAAKEAANTANEIAQNAVAAAMESVREAAEGVFENAHDRRIEIEEARNNIADSLKTAGVTNMDALKAIDEQLAAAKKLEDAAKKALDELTRSMNNDEIKLNIGGNGVQISTGNNTIKNTIKNTLKNANKQSAQDGKNEKSSAKSDDALKFDGTINGTRLKGSIDLSGTAIPPIKVETVDIVGSPPLPPLPPTPLAPEIRNDIRKSVTTAAKRIGLGSILILIFIPVFIVTLFAKYFIDRARRATAYAETQTREAEFQSANRQIVEARLQALQAQVEPHFLYNTLANVQALTEVDPPLANKMVGHLIQYLRAALPKMRETTSTVGQEVELVRAYLNILKIRMGDRLAFDIAVPAELETLPFPPLMLPSLVENAIKHGLEPQRDGGRIDVIAEKIGEDGVGNDGATIRMIVKDTGRGLTDAPSQAGGGVGLSNIRERLQALFGDCAKLTLESNEPKGVVATIDVPAAPTATMAAFSATGETPARTRFGNATAKPAQPAPSGFAARTWWIARRTHSIWLRILTAIFIGVVIVLGVGLLLSLVGIVTGVMPVTLFNHLELSGIEGMAFGSVVLLAAFCLLVLVAVILAVLAYGLGVLFGFLLVGIPIIVLISAFPAMAPFILVGLIVWWFMKRGKKKASNEKLAALAGQQSAQEANSSAEN